MTAFLTANSGLKSRLPKHLTFPDYTDEELVAIFTRMAAQEGLTLTPDVRTRLREILREIPATRPSATAASCGTSWTLPWRSSPPA